MAMPAFIFETPRLRARQIEASDVDAMLAVYGDAEVVRWVADGLPLDRARCEQWVEVTHRNYATRGYGMVTLLDRQSAATIGFCGLVHPTGQAEPELKYALRRDHWGKGLATEAAAAMLAYGATTFGISKVIATTAPENTASHSVLLKVGMQWGELRRNDDGSYTQLFVWHLGAQQAENAL
jgi:RimJ/RimL family protein N-acetyltransferase